MREPHPFLFILVVVGVIADITSFALHGTIDLLRESRLNGSPPSASLVLSTFGWRWVAAFSAVALAYSLRKRGIQSYIA